MAAAACLLEAFGAPQSDDEEENQKASARRYMGAIMIAEGLRDLKDLVKALTKPAEE